MAYKLEPGLGRITSAVILLFPGGEKKEFRDGKAATEAVFDRSFRVTEIQAVENTVEIKLKYSETPESTNWIGEEQTFF